MSLIEDVSKSEWQDFSQHWPSASLFQRPEMFDVYVRAHGFVPHVLGFTGTRGELAALLAWVEIYPTRVAIPFTGRALVVDGPIGSEDGTLQLLTGLDDAACKRATFSEIRNLTEPRSRAPFEQSGYVWEDHLNYVLDLAPGEEPILGAMSKERRREIKKADSAGLELVDLSHGDLDLVYRVLRLTYQRARVPLADISLFDTALELLGPMKALTAIGAKISDALCSVLLLLRWNGTVYCWYTGSTEEGRRHHANAWLHRQGIREAIQIGAIRFDFGGAGHSGANYGPGIFKRRFGGAETHPGRFRRIYHPFLYQLSMRLFDAWRGGG